MLRLQKNVSKINSILNIIKDVFSFTESAIENKVSLITDNLDRPDSRINTRDVNRQD